MRSLRCVGSGTRRQPDRCLPVHAGRDRPTAGPGRGGAIVNTASIAGLVGGFGSAYVASKHGVLGLTKHASLEYAQQGIRINAVCPGVIPTPLVESAFARRPGLEERWLASEPIGRFGTPDEVAAAVVWLCSDAASFITGVGLPVDGGWLAQ